MDDFSDVFPIPPASAPVPQMSPNEAAFMQRVTGFGQALRMIDQLGGVTRRPQMANQAAKWAVIGFAGFVLYQAFRE
jgi:hypothetical protein